MRTIKFKAKRLDNGKWIKGFYWSNLIGNHFIRIAQNNKDEYTIEDFEIDENTLCEYIGLKDKYGEEIYENDEIFFLEEDIGTIKLDKNDASFVFDCKDVLYSIENMDLTFSGRVIGNEFD